jgi:DNA polymerase-1
MAFIALDTETCGTNALDYHRSAHMFAFSLCMEDGSTEVYRVDRGKRSRIHAIDVLRRLTDGGAGSPRLVFHNSKYDLRIIENLLKEKIAERIRFEDTLIQSKILRNNIRSHGLKDLAWELARVPKDDERALKPFRKDYSQAPRYLMDTYQRRDAERTMLLHLFQRPKIETVDAFEKSYRMHLKLIVATMRLEQRGLQIDFDAVKAMQLELLTRIVKNENRLLKYVGRRININSSRDVGWLLYEHEKLPITAVTKKAHAPSTDKLALLRMREDTGNKCVEWILQNRSYSKGVQTLESYVSLADESGSLLPTVNTNGAVTGRESCENPNLQNVAKSTTLLNPYPVLARKVFVPKAGCFNIYADYAGIEMRLLVDYSGEEELISILHKGGDVHLPATQLFFGKRFSDAIEAGDKQLAKTLRTAAKNANFAIPYGASAARIAQCLGCGQQEAEKAYAEYKRRLPKLCALNAEMSKMVRKQGYVFTKFGTRLYVEPEKSYAALNYCIQGTAAEILKYAQVRVHAYLKRESKGQAGILLPIHDELVMEFPLKNEKRSYRLLRGVKRRMERFDIFSVPLEVEFSRTDTNWEEKREITL